MTFLRFRNDDEGPAVGGLEEPAVGELVDDEQPAVGGLVDDEQPAAGGLVDDEEPAAGGLLDDEDASTRISDTNQFRASLREGR